ncbi:MAG TPA: Trm112 family protein [Planctomycetota bacterium]|nr:Trm112 family protein [Planctomycetota bacterium]
MLDKELLEILACPETKEAVALAGEDVVRRLNERIAKGELVNRGGEKVIEKIEAALVRSDGKVAYPVRDGIPIMLVEEALPL